MESKLPAPPSMRTIASRSRSSSSAMPLEPSKLPLPARRRSRLQSAEEEGDVSSSASTTSSPEVAVTNGTMMAVPPRLELHDLTVNGSEHARVASSDANAPGRDVLADAADAFLVRCYQQQQLLQATAPRTGIPSLGMQKTHSQSRLAPGSTRLQANSVEKQPSRIGRYEPKKKPPPPMIDTHWNSEVDDSGGDHSGTTLPTASCTALQSDDRQANPLSDHCAALGRPESIITQAQVPAPPMAPPSVRVPHLHVDGNMQGGHPNQSTVTDPKEPQSLTCSPSMLQRLKMSVEPPKTPSGGLAFEAFNDDDESRLSASQRVRMGLSVLMTQGNGNGAMGADMMRRKSHEEESQRSQHDVAAPKSCPRLPQVSGKQQFAALKETQPQRHHSQPRGSNLIASKLLPSRMCLNTLIEYVRELNQSAASLRMELEHTRQKAEKELFEAHVQVDELQTSVQRAEFERDQARVRAEEQEQLVRDLQAQVITLQQQVQAAASSFSQMEAFVSNSLHYETLQASVSTAVDEVASHFTVNGNEAISGVRAVRKDPTEAGSQHQLQQEGQKPRDAHSQQLVLSPRIAKPLWKPWSSESNSPLASAVNPPMFTIAPSESDLLPSSPELVPTAASVTGASSANHDHELKSIVSPKNLMRAQDRELKPHHFPTTPATTENCAHTVPHPSTPPIFSLAAVSIPELNELQMPTTVGALSGNGNSITSITGMEPAVHQVPAETSSPLPNDLASPVTVFPPPFHEDSRADDSTHSMASAVQPKLFLPVQAQHSEKSPVPRTTPESTAASLEKLLTDFFSEFDKSKMRMAEVYGKRYVGHEDKLFAELTRRYGKDKVALLQHRYEESLVATQVVDSSFLQAGSLLSQDAPTTVTEATRGAPECAAVQYPLKLVAEEIASARQVQAMRGICASGEEVMSGEVPTQKVSPRGRFRPNDHGFHVPDRAELPSLSEEECEVSEPDTSSKYMSNGAAWFSPVAAVDDDIQHDAPCTSQRSKQSSSASPHRVAPQRRPTPFFPPMGGVVDLKTDAPPLSTREFNFANGGGTKSSPIRRQGELSTGQPPLFSSFLNETSEDKKLQPAATLQSASPGPLVEISKTVLAKSPVSVGEQPTVESLLNELYKKHQPDKLRNVAQIAKEYAGKERVLVRLLKAKYGALSVKRLEENLHVLENSDERQKAIAEAKLKASKRKAGVAKFVTRCALVSVASLSLGGACLALLNSSECRSIQTSPSQSNTGTNSATCYKLNLGLEEFEFGKIPEYVGQSYPVECFCTNWVEREDAFLSSHSGGDLVSLAKMLPFSRTAVDAYLVDAPVRQYYATYAQPIIEISKEYAPVVQSALAEVYEGVSARFTELQEQIFSFVAPLNESENDFTIEKESAATALTKVARASKSLLDSLQEDGEEEAERVESGDVTEGVDSANDAKHESDVVLEESNVLLDSALVEVAVLQEGVDISYAESRDMLDVADNSVSSSLALDQDIDLSDITAHAKDEVQGDDSSVNGEADSIERVFDRGAGATGRAAAAAEEVAVGGQKESTIEEGTVVNDKRSQSATSLESSESRNSDVFAPAILKVEESVSGERAGAEADFDETNRGFPTESDPMDNLERPLSKQMAIVHTKESTPDSQTVEKPSEDGASPARNTVEDFHLIQTESTAEVEVTSSSRLFNQAHEFPSVGDAQQVDETIPLQGDDEAIILDEPAAAGSTERDVVSDGESVEAVVAAKEDAAKSEAPSAHNEVRVEKAEVAESKHGAGKNSVAEEKHSPSEAENFERPPVVTEEDKSPAFSGYQEDSNGNSHAVNDDDDDDDDLNLDFGAELFDLDPWELLEMAERAAAAQLSTQKR